MRQGMPERLARDRPDTGPLRLMSSHEFRIKNNCGLSVIIQAYRAFAVAKDRFIDNGQIPVR